MENMEKNIFITILGSMVLLISCNLNDYPVFNDADAFVSFESEMIAVNEDAVAFKVPVRLTSLGNLSSTVTFETFDGTAVTGRDYNITGGASVLTFDGSSPIQYIDIEILSHKGEFTSDRIFGIALKNAGSVNMGSNDTTYVTILDIDHPLSAILGDYSVYGPNLFSGRADNWSVTLEKDSGGDVSKVWISNLVVDGTNETVFGIVNEEKNKIEIPVKQTIAKSSTYTSILLEGFDDPDMDVADLLPDGSKITMDLTQSSPIVFTMDLPFGSHIVDTDQWYSIVLAGATFTKK